MSPKRVMWVRRYQGQCRALRPLGHQGYRLRSYNKDQPLCSGYIGGSGVPHSCSAQVKTEMRGMRSEWSAQRARRVRLSAVLAMHVPNRGIHML